MVEEDKYPESSGRRRFVKGVVGSAALTGLGTTAAASVNVATPPAGAGGGATEYIGVERVGGPAPRGMPQIPIEIDDEGFIRGVWPEVKEVEEQGQTFKIAETNLGGETYSSTWFQYCGVQSTPGVQPESGQENYFRYTASSYEWQQEEVSTGDRVNIDHFQDYEEWGNGIGKSGLGKPATASWRSQDVEPADIMPVQVVRSKRVEQQAQNNEWLSASTDQGVFAWMNRCTHFCCTPSFKGSADSASFDAENKVYCQCHQSVYNPFNLVKETFVALPRPEE